VLLVSNLDSVAGGGTESVALPGVPVAKSQPDDVLALTKWSGLARAGPQHAGQLRISSGASQISTRVRLLLQRPDPLAGCPADG
jgi:hypothetical protein